MIINEILEGNSLHYLSEHERNVQITRYKDVWFEIYVFGTKLPYAIVENIIVTLMIYMNYCYL